MTSTTIKLTQFEKDITGKVKLSKVIRAKKVLLCDEWMRDKICKKPQIRQIVFVIDPEGFQRLMRNKEDFIQELKESGIILHLQNPGPEKRGPSLIFAIVHQSQETQEPLQTLKIRSLKNDSVKDDSKMAPWTIEAVYFDLEIEEIIDPRDFRSTFKDKYLTPAQSDLSLIFEG